MVRESGGVRVRAEAARVVHAVVDGGRSLDRVLADALTVVPLSEHALLRLMCYEALRFYWRYAARVDGLLKSPIKKRDRVVHALLVVGVFQLLASRVPAHAAVSQTVEATRLLRRPTLKGLVNGVLRNLTRQSAAANTVAEEADECIRFNHPRWFIERLRRDWPQHWQAVLEANNERAPLWLRVNHKRITTQAYRERLAAGAALDEVSSVLPGAPQALRLQTPCPVEDLPGFAEGLCSVQDAAAQLAAPWLLAAGGARILDACAAPGGKTAHLLELCAEDATLTAIDVSAERAAQIGAGLKRLGLEATVLAADASKPDDWWDGRAFDRILLDAPCSASGVLRRHPDAKHLRRASDIQALAEAQRRLLDACWDMLAAAGRLLYVTCSVFVEENDAVIEAALKRHPDMHLNNVLPNNNNQALMRPTACGLQILPGTRGLDGFYFACLEKQSNR